MKGGVELNGIVSTLTRNEEFTAGAQQALPKKCRDPRIFSVPCTIGDCTFADAMLDLGTSINVMPTSIYKSLNFSDLEPTRMTIQLANKSVVQPLGVLKHVLVQVNELIFPADFYVLDMEDETSGKRSTLILGRPFLMTGRTKIDVHVRTLSINPPKDHSLFGIDLIDELVEECFQLDTSGEDISNFARDIEVFDCLRSITDKVNSDELWEVHSLFDSEDDHTDLADLSQEAKLLKLLEQTRTRPNPANMSQPQQQRAKIMLVQLVSKLIQVGQSDLKLINDTSSSLPPPIELKPLPSHLKYAYLDTKLSPSILDGVRKKVTKLLAARIIYPISNSQWASPVQVVPMKSGMTIMKNQHKELVTMRIQNNWRVCIDYRRLNQANHKDHFPLPFIDQVLEKLIHIAPEDQPKTTFTCPFGTFAYTRILFGLCNMPSTFQRCMTSIFSNLLQDWMEVFIDDFTVYANSFDACLRNLSKVLTRCIDTNLVLNFEKCHFMVTEGIILGHLVSNRGIEVDKSKIDIITSLPNPASVREVRSFLGHVGFYRRIIQNFSKIALPLSKLLQKDELKNQLTFIPILQAPNWDYPFELMCDASNSALGAILS
ncbi:Retrovirus-related Pol polyprotein from transposon 17.6, partial [Mucuna pruriens]